MNIFIGQGTPLVFLHGAGEDSRVWLDVVGKGFAGFRSYLLDLPGHGSNRHVEGPFTFEGYSTAVEAWLNEQGLTGVVLVGRSLGALIAHHLYLAKPSLFTALICVNYGTRLEFPDGFLERLAREPRLAIREMMLPITLPEERKESLGPEIEGLLMENRGALLYDFAILKARSIRKPYGAGRPGLIVAGLRDRLVPPSSSQELQRLLPGSRLLLLGDAGHFIPMEKPGLLRGAMEAFFGELRRKALL